MVGDGTYLTRSAVISKVNKYITIKLYNVNNLFCSPANLVAFKITLPIRSDAVPRKALRPRSERCHTNNRRSFMKGYSLHKFNPRPIDGGRTHGWQVTWQTPVGVSTA
jgi:hypothetical protein